MTLKIVIVDDHPLMVEGMRGALADAPDMQVVGVAGTGREALSLVARIKPCVVLMDIHLPELDGLECLERIRRDHPQTKVVMCSASTEGDRIAAAFRLGAAAYVVKSVNSVDLPSAIRQACERTVFHPFGHGEEAEAAKPLDLTPRECTILGAVAGGLSNKEIGKELWVGEQTVKFHLTNIYRKLGVSNRTAAAQVAREHGLTRLTA